MLRTLLLLSSLLLLRVQPLLAQPSTAQQPLSFQPAVAQVLAQRQLPATALTQPDLRRIREEDAQKPGMRFAAPIPVDFGLQNAGVWADLPDGARLWRLKITASGALGLIALYDEWFIPEGAQLFMYTPNRQTVLGPFTSKDNTASGKFLTGLTVGEEAVLEYYEPASVRGQGRLHLFRVDYAYHQASLESAGIQVRSTRENELGFGSTDSCQLNVACQTALDMAPEKRAICRIIMVLVEGTGFCSGSLINNSAADATPYLISAFHCQDGYIPIFDLWRFDFNYQSTACDNPVEEPAYRSIVGCSMRAGYRETDFMLLELAQRIPGSFQAYFLGWDRSGATPDEGVIYHHPRGDIKKFAIDDDGINVFRDTIDWNNGVKTPPEHHFNSRFDVGSFDIGSSGAPLLNESRRFVGQLHGGYMACSGSSAYFGRLFKSWEGGGSAQTRLKDWLDPLRLNMLTVDGMENIHNSGAEISGGVYTENGLAVSGAKVSVVTESGAAFSTITDSVGQYALAGIPFGEALEIGVTKNDFAGNGCSTADLIKVQKHILGITLMESTYQRLAADVNLSATISTQDLIQMRKIVLGVESSFRAVPAWFFIPAAVEFPNAPDPFTGITWPLEHFYLEGLEDSIPDLDFVAIKYGDVNGSATPDN